MYVDMYIYIYIYREREREIIPCPSARAALLPLQVEQLNSF